MTMSGRSRALTRNNFFPHLQSLCRKLTIQISPSPWPFCSARWAASPSLVPLPLSSQAEASGEVSVPYQVSWAWLSYKHTTEDPREWAEECTSVLFLSPLPFQHGAGRVATGCQGLLTDTQAWGKLCTLHGGKSGSAPGAQE